MRPLAGLRRRYYNWRRVKFIRNPSTQPTMSKLTRTFIAVDFDNPLIVERVQELQRRIQESGAVIKAVEPQNLHITLWFLGELEQHRLDTVLREVREVRFKEFKVMVKGMGYFPGGGRVNVIWLGVEDPSGGFDTILDQLLGKLGRHGFRYDERGFTPHLTIGRVKRVKDRQRLLQTINELKDIQVGEQEVMELKVKKSTLTPRGPIYSDLLVVEAERQS